MLRRDFGGLHTWVAATHPRLERAVAEIGQRHDARTITSQRALVETISALSDADDDPIFDGHPCDAAGLTVIARQAIGGSVLHLRLIEQIFATKALEVFARAREHRRLRTVQLRWCALVDTAHGILRRQVPTAQVPDGRLLAHLLNSALSRAGARQLAGLADRVLTDESRSVGWFAAIAAIPASADDPARDALLVVFAAEAQAQIGLGRRAEVNEWTRGYLGAGLDARIAANRRRRLRGQMAERRGSTARLMLVCLAVAAVVATQTWSVARQSTTGFVLAAATITAASLVGAHLGRRTQAALLLALIGRYGLLGTLAGAAVALVFERAGNSEAALPAAWWAWGAAMLTAVVVCAAVGANGRRPVRKVRR